MKNISNLSLNSIVILLNILFMIPGNLLAQNNIAQEQCKKIGRGINIIGYDKMLWKDHTQGRFKEKYFLIHVSNFKL